MKCFGRAFVTSLLLWFTPYGEGAAISSLPALLFFFLGYGTTIRFDDREDEPTISGMSTSGARPVRPRTSGRDAGRLRALLHWIALPRRRSERFRSRAVRGLNITYSVSWLRQEENQYLSVPADVARTLPDELLRLLGYARGAYALGYVDDLRDPLDALRGVASNDVALGDLEAATARARRSG